MLDGTGTLHSTLTVLSGGLVSPGFSPGTLTIDGNAEFRSGSVLKIEIGGLDPGQFDVLDVLGDLSFNDALIELDFINGFVPHAGDHVDFLRAASLHGLESVHYSFHGLGSGFLFDVLPEGGGLRFVALNDGQAVPLPSALALGLLGLALMPLARRHCRSGGARASVSALI